MNCPICFHDFCQKKAPQLIFRCGNVICKPCSLAIRGQKCPFCRQNCGKAIPHPMTKDRSRIQKMLIETWNTRPKNVIPMCCSKCYDVTGDAKLCIYCAAKKDDSFRKTIAKGDFSGQKEFDQIGYCDTCAEIHKDLHFEDGFSVRLYSMSEMFCSSVDDAIRMFDGMQLFKVGGASFNTDIDIWPLILKGATAKANNTLSLSQLVDVVKLLSVKTPVFKHICKVAQDEDGDNKEGSANDEDDDDEVQTEAQKQGQEEFANGGEHFVQYVKAKLFEFCAQLCRLANQDFQKERQVQKLTTDRLSLYFALQRSCMYLIHTNFKQTNTALTFCRDIFMPAQFRLLMELQRHSSPHEFLQVKTVLIKDCKRFSTNDIEKLAIFCEYLTNQSEADPEYQTANQLAQDILFSLLANEDGDASFVG